MLALVVAPVGHVVTGTVQVAALVLVLLVSLLPVVRDQRTRAAIGEASTTSG
ncbi:MAG: hypothetical protein ABIQ59_09230 [Nocardioidaceae bacterium]